MTEAEREFLSLIIGHRVRELRKNHRLSQAELSSGVGSQSMISLIEGGRQLPPADVLHAIAARLADPVLKNYAESLENNTLADFKASSHNEVDLMSILVNHRGRWHPAHERIASQLCHHYYYTRNFQLVEDLCQIIIHHVQSNSAKAEAFFYLGSGLLQQHQFKEAEEWLLKADELSDDLSDSFKGRLAYNLGYAYSFLDIQVLALWYASRAVDIFHRLNDFLNQGNSLGLLGAIQTRLGRLNEAKQTLSTAYDILNRWGSTPTNTGRVSVSIAEVCALLNQEQEAITNIKIATDLVDESDYLCKADVFRIQTYLALQHEDKESAMKFVHEGVKAALNVNDPFSLAQLYLLRIQMTEDTSEKIDSAKKAYDITHETNHHILHALAAECMANLLDHSIEHQEDVKFYMQSALDSYRTYVHKNSMFTNLIDNLPIYEAYPAEEVEDVIESPVEI